MALFCSPNPEQCGIAELDSKGKIIRFEEKPEQPESNLANGGVYVADADIFEAIPDTRFSDFGKDVLPKLVGDMYGWETKSFILDIGTHKNYEKAQKEWKK
jgi:mannose-1-phosphate guanylyltransferase